MVSHWWWNCVRIGRFFFAGTMESSLIYPFSGCRSDWTNLCSIELVLTRFEASILSIPSLGGQRRRRSSLNHRDGVFWYSGARMNKWTSGDRTGRSDRAPRVIVLIHVDQPAIGTCGGVIIWTRRRPFSSLFLDENTAALPFPLAASSSPETRTRLTLWSRSS